jgi:glycerophosphoryl diester phosphodiesterase
VVGHAGLAIDRAGGAPTRRHLDRAVALGLERLELDVCSSADGRPVARHDARLPDGRAVAGVDLAELRRHDAGLLTLDDVCDQLGAQIPLLLDVKTTAAAHALGLWFRGRRDLEQYTLCTENRRFLLHLRFASPRVARWPSFPDLGDSRSHHVQHVLAGLWRSHTSIGGLRRGLADMHRAARQLRRHPHLSLAHIGGLPWRERLPIDLERLCVDLAAAGICVQQWLISTRLVEAAHGAGLHVNTWTINNALAAPLIAASGVDSITTDRVAAMRLGLGLGRRPPFPAPTAAPLRVAGRTSPR